VADDPRPLRLAGHTGGQAHLQGARRGGPGRRRTHRDQSSGVARYNRLSASLRNQRALLYALARYYRRAGDIDKARDIVLKAPSNHAELIDAEQWWIERRILIRQSIGPKNKKHWPGAYKMAAAHGFPAAPITARASSWPDGSRSGCSMTPGRR
jgi:hypothetical protein